MNWSFIFSISILVLLTLGLSIGLHFFKNFNTDKKLNLYEQIDILENDNSKDTICTKDIKIIPIKGPLGIFIDYENCHNFYLEFLIIESIIKGYSKQFPNLLFYDEEHFSNSSIITIGNSKIIEKDKKRDIIYIKYKLLKDILYNQIIFDKITDILKSYIQTKLNITLLEFNTVVNFKNFKQKYIHILKDIDRRNMYSIVCQETLQSKKKFFIKVDYNKIERFFVNKETIEIYKMFLNRIVEFISIAIETMSMLKNEEDSESYKILLTFRTNNSNFILSPHKVIINENKELKIDNLKEFVSNLIITMKHKIFHSLGFPHSYFFDSVMLDIEDKIQKENLFYFFTRDINMLHICYEKNNNIKNQFTFLENNNNINKSEFELNLFINDYELFLKRYISLIM
jgi:hypothetical protein